jgi:hypothetical protein
LVLVVQQAQMETTAYSQLSHQPLAVAVLMAHLVVPRIVEHQAVQAAVVALVMVTAVQVAQEHQTKVMRAAMDATKQAQMTICKVAVVAAQVLLAVTAERPLAVSAVTELQLLFRVHL